MKKFLFLFSLVFLALLNFNFAGAKEKSCVRRGFLYEYKVQKKGTWITKITPISNKGISTLNIPKKLGGKGVVKLGSTGAIFFIGDINTKEPNPNIFGVEDSSEGDGTLVPEDVQELVKKIKKIQIPSTVDSIALNCFSDVPDGKIINIPKGIVRGLDEEGYGFTKIKWKKITVSSKNKKYKISNGCLLSRNGKKLYGFVQRKKKIDIPESVKTITNGGDYNGTSIIVIPKSVTKIKENALSTKKPVAIKVSSKNKRYAVNNGSLYSKKTGRLVAAYIKDGVLDIPGAVKTVNHTGVLGLDVRIKKVIVPSSVTGVAFPYVFLEQEPLIYEFKGIMPPKMLDLPGCCGFEKSKIYVQKNCRETYLKKWKAVKTQNIQLNIMEQDKLP